MAHSGELTLRQRLDEPVPVRQWVLSFPIPLRVLFAAHPHLLSSVLQIVHRVIATFLIKQAGIKRTQAHTGAVTLIQRFGSAANLNIHLHCLVLDGVYRTTEGVPVFHAVRAPTTAELQALLARIIKRLMKFLTRKGSTLAGATARRDRRRVSRPRHEPRKRRRATGHRSTPELRANLT